MHSVVSARVAAPRFVASRFATVLSAVVPAPATAPAFGAAPATAAAWHAGAAATAGKHRVDAGSQIRGSA